MNAHVNFADKSNPCVVLNVSAGGMLVETREPLPAGIPVAINLAQPGWTRVLRLPGRVVWALAPKAAAKKNQPPGMRIRFDPLEPETAEMLLELLHSLGIGETPPPDRSTAEATLPLIAPPPRTASKREVPTVDAPLGAPKTHTIRGAPQTQTLPGARTQELAVSDIVAHISKIDLPAVIITTPRKESPTGGRKVGVDEETRLAVQVRGLKMQLTELQEALDARDRELAETKDALHTKQLALEKADRERRAAETAIQRLSMQLAHRR